MDQKIRAIVFDLGGVLIDWKPEYLYRKIFDNEKEMRDFLSGICTSEWNEQHDAGRPLQEGTEELVKQFPHYENEIRAYYGRWEEMLGGEMAETVELLRKLRQQDHLKLYALTNWSAETYPIAEKKYEFLQWFDGIIVSGKEKTRKPFSDIFQLLLKRFHLSASSTLFIDDNLRNVKAAASEGFQTIHFTTAEELEKELEEMLGG